jgi:hypothetical protein
VDPMAAVLETGRAADSRRKKTKVQHQQKNR